MIEILVLVCPEATCIQTNARSMQLTSMWLPDDAKITCRHGMDAIPRRRTLETDLQRKPFRERMANWKRTSQSAHASVDG